MSARAAELSLTVFAVVLALFLFISTDFATDTGLAPDAFGFLVGFSVLAVLAHLGVRRLAPDADPILLPMALGLIGIGIAMIRRLDGTLGANQLAWAGIAVALFLATLAIFRDHRGLEDFRYTMLVIGVGLLLLPLTPIGTDLGRSARLWISIAGFTFQPAEAAKIVLSVFLAGYLASKREVMTIAAFRLGPVGVPAPRHFGPLIIAWGMSLAVMFYERDLGSSLLFFTLFLATMYMATSRLVYVVTGLGLFAAGVSVALERFSHVQVRIDAWLNPWSNDPVSGILAGGRQIAQSWYALGAGGMAGTGIGRGHPDLIDPGLRSGTLPTDFIFAALGEELGLFGASAILLIFGLIIARGYTIALRSTDTFGSLLAGALTTIFGLQAFLIMGGVTRLLPLTGITLPFVSYGGSSLVMNAVLLAILLRISDRSTGQLEEASA